MKDSPRILLIDDDPDDLALIELVLHQAFDVVELILVSDAVSFAEHLHTGGIHSIICSSRLSWGDAMRVLESVRRHYPSAPIILFRSQHETHLSLTTSSCNPVAWLKKDSSGFMQLPQLVRLQFEAGSAAAENSELSLYRSLVEEVTYGLFRINQFAEIQQCNQAFAELLDYAKTSDVTGFDLGQWSDGNDRAQEFLELLPQLNGELRLNLNLRTKGDKTVTVSVRICPLLPLAAESLFTVLVEQVNPQNQVKHVDLVPAIEQPAIASANKVRTETSELMDLIHLVSHDLQDPLQLIERYAGLLQERHHGQLDEDAQRYLGNLIGSSARMQDMVDGLLEYSRLQSSDFVFQRVNLNQVVSDALANLRGRIDDSNARLVIGDLPEVTGDWHQLRQLFQNLVGNAIKFNRNDLPQIEIVASECNQGWLITVQDNGIGIREQDHSVIFEMYQRLHTEEEFPGTGVGLALCKRIIERHGGHISVTSRPEEGTRFDLILARQGATGVSDGNISGVIVA